MVGLIKETNGAAIDLIPYFTVSLIFVLIAFLVVRWKRDFPACFRLHSRALGPGTTQLQRSNRCSCAEFQFAYSILGRIVVSIQKIGPSVWWVLHQSDREKR